MTQKYECGCSGDSGCLCDNLAQQEQPIITDSDRILQDFEHNFNPAHFYCRLREIGLGKPAALTLSAQYQEIYNHALLYIPLNRREES